jgi:ATP-dependent helicase/DNAse subunit B
MIVKSDKLKVSASALKTYEQCPRKYFYTYIEKLPKKKWPHAELGDFVHNSLEEFHNHLKDNEVHELEWGPLLGGICRSQLKEMNLTSEQKLTAKKMLDTYLRVLRASGLPKVLFNEKAFTLEIPDDIIIRGYIDRVDEDGDSFHIIDYKSGKSKYLDEFQLTVYALAMMSEHPQINKIRGSYLVLGEGCKSIPYTISRTDAERCSDKIRKESDKIRSDQTWATKPTRLCSYCDFEQACPATKSSDANQWGSVPGAL